MIEVHLHGGSILQGRVDVVAGKVANITLVNQEDITAEDIDHLVTAGKEDSTMVQDNRYRLLIRAMKNPEELFSSPFLRLLWYQPNPRFLPWPPATHPRPAEPLEIDFYKTLNPSQEDAANAALLLDDDNRITILVGPPGSGLDFSLFFTL
jgi:hypothetical protein